MQKLKAQIEKSNHPMAKVIGEFVEGQLGANGVIFERDKTLDGCIKAIYSKARERAKGQSFAAVEDKVVYGWIAEYFGLRYENKPEAAAAPKAQTLGTDDFLSYELEDLF